MQNSIVELETVHAITIRPDSIPTLPGTWSDPNRLELFYRLRLTGSLLVMPNEQPNESVSTYEQKYWQRRAEDWKEI